MGIITDIINALPTNAALKAENEKLKSEKDVLDTEIACLKDDLRKSEIEVAKLKSEIEKQKLELEKLEEIQLDEIDWKILKTLWANADAYYPEDFEETLRLSASEVAYRLEELEDKGLVMEDQPYITQPAITRLTQEGRAFIAKTFSIKKPVSE